MNTFKINNIYKEEGQTLNEVIVKFFITFLDDDLNFCNVNEFRYGLK